MSRYSTGSAVVSSSRRKAKTCCTAVAGCSKDAASLGERASALKAGQTGLLRVGAPTQVIENFLAPFVTRYQRRHPGIDIHLFEAAAGRLPTHLDRGDVHVGSNRVT